MNIKAFIPNLFTCANLFCGCVGIVFAFNENLVYSSILIGIAAVLDFLDGFLARLLKAQSEIGKQLDSLADMVTFGVLPGIILYQFATIGFREYFLTFDERSMHHFYWALVCLIVPVAAGLRLAKFNIDTRQTVGFRGLPTPAVALLVASFPLSLGLQFKMNIYYPIRGNMLDSFIELYYLGAYDQWLIDLLHNPYFHIITALVLAVLMISPIPMVSLKFKSFGFKANWTRYILLLLCGLMVLCVFLPYWDLPFVDNLPWLDYSVIGWIIILYIVYSIIVAFIPKKNEVQS